MTFLPPGGAKNAALVAWTTATLIVQLAVAAFFTTFVLVGFVACLAEDRNPFVSLFVSFDRCVWGRRWIPACAIGFAIVLPSLAATFAGLMLGELFDGIVPATSMPVIYALSEALGLLLGAMAFAIGLNWSVTFSLDARVRAEGLDLLALAHADEEPNAPSGH